MRNRERYKQQKDSYIPHWSPERFTIPLLARRIPEMFREFVERLVEGRRGLDAGCGMQPFRWMFEQAGFHYTGLDVIQNRIGTVDVLGALDENLPAVLLESSPFDFILCTEVLEHVADWSIAYDNLSRLLAPGGRLLLTCPHFYPLHETPYDFWRPTPFAVEHFAETNHLNIVHLENAGGPWEVLGTLLAETHCYPVTNRLIDRIVAKLGRIIRNAVNSWLISDWIRAHACLKGPYFLSVYAVLEKAKTEATMAIPLT
jgi:SAM-dependent methyltransferase